VWISTGPKDCSGVTLPAQIMLERVDGQWTLKGTWFEQPIAGDEAATKELTFSANDTGQSADGPVLVLQLSGAGKFGDYKVEITGTAEAIECVN
jgi:hypothetical protein